MRGRPRPLPSQDDKHCQHQDHKTPRHTQQDRSHSTPRWPARNRGGCRAGGRYRAPSGNPRSGPRRGGLDLRGWTGLLWSGLLDRLFQVGPGARGRGGLGRRWRRRWHRGTPWPQFGGCRRPGRSWPCRLPVRLTPLAGQNVERHQQGGAQREGQHYSGTRPCASHHGLKSTRGVSSSKAFFRSLPGSAAGFTRPALPMSRYCLKNRLPRACWARSSGRFLPVRMLLK